MQNSFIRSSSQTRLLLNKLVEDGYEYANTKDILNCQKNFTVIYIMKRARNLREKYLTENKGKH